MIIALGTRSYPVLFHHQADYLALLNSYCDKKRVAIITDEVVWPLHGKRFADGLSSLQSLVITLPAGEAHKSLVNLTHIFDQLMNQQYTRDTVCISFGGGVITDITGLAASLYQRGVGVIHIPTTLLAQVDASIGGKTAINYQGVKNNIGTFYQPQAVIIDTYWLATLPQRDYQAGLAEVVKMAIAFDSDFFAWLEAQADKLLAREEEIVLHAITKSCALKAAVIAEDEYDIGRRALLNLGHTFAHAIESAFGYTWLHGEAVAIGLLAAAKCAVAVGYLQQGDADRIEQLLLRLALPIRLPINTDSDELVHLMAFDKKVTVAGVNIIIPTAIGNATRLAAVPTMLLGEVIRGISLDI